MQQEHPLTPLERSLVLASLIFLSVMPVFSQASRVDHSKANVNGRRGYAMWPNVNGTPGDPTGYEVVLARREHPESWLRFAAGKWQEVPAGEYMVLLEGNSEVTPYPHLLHWSNDSYSGHGLAGVLSVVAAGRVHLSGDCPSKRCLGWMLHERSNVEALHGYLEPEMLRWSSLEEAQSRGVLMPAGRVATALYDAVRKEFTAIQVPTQVPPLRSTRIQATRPRDGRAALILEMTRPAVVITRPEKDVEVKVIAGGKPLDPAFVTRTHRKIIAIFSDVAAGPARIEVSSSDVRLPRNEIRLGSGKVEHIQRGLVPLPKLGVSWSIPDELKAAHPTLRITNLAGRESIQDIPLEKQSGELDLRVPAAPHEATLKSGPWSLREKADLSDGADHFIRFEMDPIRVTGRVYYGDEPAQATITFRTDANWQESLRVRTTADGQYEALFAKPYAYSASVDLEGRNAPYPVVGFVVEHDATKDIHIPANAYHFRITRKDDGRPIEGANIVLQNRANGDDGLVITQRLTTGPDGIATAQPLRAGTMAANVYAEGFVHLENPAESVLEKGERNIDLALEPVGLTDTLTLHLPDGAPAAGASVMVHANREDRMETADAEGHVAIPRADTGGVVLVKAPRAALAARFWHGEDQTWTLESPGAPLVIHAMRSDGSDAPAAPGVLWLDGVRLSGFPLGWLTSTAGGTDTAGFWVLRNLPLHPVQVLMWRYSDANVAPVTQGRFDSMRTTITPPWPSIVEVKALE